MLILDVLKASFEQVSAAVKREDRSGGGVETGLKTLNERVGLYAGSVTIVAGRPGAGKTSLVLNIAREAAAAGHTVIVVSPCSTAGDVGHRIVCAEAAVDPRKLAAGYLTADDWNRLTQAASFVGTLPIHIDDSPYVTMSTIRASVSAVLTLLAEESVKRPVVVLDYVQMVRSEPRRQNRYEELCDVSRDLKCLAREHGAAIVAASSLNRKGTLRDDPRPRLGDLRDSGTLEDDADVVLFIHPTEDPHDEQEAGQLSEIIVAKNRNGFPMRFEASLDLPTGRWCEAVDHQAPR